MNIQEEETITFDGRASTSGAGTDAPTVVIEPTRGWVSLKLADLWDYRELLYFLTWRDIKVRYKQTMLGALWAVIQPLMTVLVFSVIFGEFAKLPTDGIPYPLFSLAALLPWMLFSHALTRATTSVVGSANLVKKVYFPRLVIPVASTLGGLVDFGISFLILLGLMLYYGVAPSAGVLLLPLLVLLALATALGVGLWLSTLNAKYRDVGHAVPFIVQVWMYASPIAYSKSIVPEKWQALYSLNPMVGVIEGFRWALLGTAPPDPFATTVSVVVAVALLVGGAFYFRRMEKTFADVT